VKNRDLSAFVGTCWPGNSVWVDYLNVAGSKYWGSLYNYNVFNGTNDLFYAWTDMDEPSVFNGPEGTIPKTALHVLGDGTYVLHRDVHNAYGLLTSFATYNGLIDRDNGSFRPFSLSRSAFFGS
jgi:alpha 1,3-glucosidase